LESNSEKDIDKINVYFMATGDNSLMATSKPTVYDSELTWDELGLLFKNMMENIFLLNFNIQNLERKINF